MRTLTRRTAIVTGASRGIGLALARKLAAEGMNLVLVGRAQSSIDAVVFDLRKSGVKALSVAMDVTDQAARQALVDKTMQTFGSIDLLVNNAAQLALAPYDQLSQKQILGMIDTNLTAPLLLTRLVLPQMLKQGQGHVVMIASLAGKTGVAYLETYAAAKAGLIAFSASLRDSYRKVGISASVVCPGPVEGGGMYDDMLSDTGVRTPLLLGASSPEAVANAVCRAVKHDLPEMIVSPRPVRPLLALQALLPRVAGWLVPRMGARVYRQAGDIYQKGKRPNVASGTAPEAPPSGEV